MPLDPFHIFIVVIDAQNVVIELQPMYTVGEELKLEARQPKAKLKVIRITNVQLGILQLLLKK